MFNNKKDPLVDAVKSVIQKSEQDRQAERLLNESLGIESKKALPHEYHAQYDAMLNEAKALSPKQERLAKLGTVTGKGGDPENIDPKDLEAAREKHAHKVGLEEGGQMSKGKPINTQNAPIGANLGDKRIGDKTGAVLGGKRSGDKTGAMTEAASWRVPKTVRQQLEKMYGPGTIDMGDGEVHHHERVLNDKGQDGYIVRTHKLGPNNEVGKLVKQQKPSKSFFKEEQLEEVRKFAGRSAAARASSQEREAMQKRGPDTDPASLETKEGKKVNTIRQRMLAIQDRKQKLEEKATEAQNEKIAKVMGEFKRRKLHSGSKKGPIVTSSDQAKAIALNQAGISKNRKMEESLESIHEEIRNTLWEKLDYVYENYGEEAAMQMYASLTEEERFILEDVGEGNDGERTGTKQFVPTNNFGRNLERLPNGPMARAVAAGDAANDFDREHGPKSTNVNPFVQLGRDLAHKSNEVHVERGVEAAYRNDQKEKEPSWNQPAQSQAPENKTSSPKPTRSTAPKVARPSTSSSSSGRPAWAQKAFNPDTGG